ncbi:hypothetical protein DPEC_G00046190 [Dallia pectoralis]|uniref:Uncharacterized protein n=1 Tax=Dallia pectoralis TaxID=75939 RepID=A0ACC2HA60_DALPE|nr:hypothetical protein DPEC_G00046190 [Dallia pectoralis]
MGIPLAPLPPAEEFDSMTGGPWSERVREPEPEAPCLPALAKYAEAAWREPLMARAPARAYMPFTRVAGRGEAITSATPRLERAMSALFLPAESQWLDRKPSLPAPKDRFTAQLADKCFQFGAQSVAAANNLALMAGAISRITTGATSISAKELADISRLVPESPLLNAPVSTTGLFGEAVETATLAFKKVEEDRMLLSRHLPLARPSRPDTSRKRRGRGVCQAQGEKAEAGGYGGVGSPGAQSGVFQTADKRAQQETSGS